MVDRPAIPHPTADPRSTSPPTHPTLALRPPPERRADLTAFRSNEGPDVASTGSDP
jgi:hypothetical protein